MVTIKSFNCEVSVTILRVTIHNLVVEVNVTKSNTPNSYKSDIGCRSNCINPDCNLSLVNETIITEESVLIPGVTIENSVIEVNGKASKGAQYLICCLSTTSHHKCPI